MIRGYTLRVKILDGNMQMKRYEEYTFPANSDGATVMVVQDPTAFFTDKIEAEFIVNRDDENDRTNGFPPETQKGNEIV